MKHFAIAMVGCMGFLVDLAILAVGTWLTFFLGHSFWWWLLILSLSWGQTVATYKIVNAINGMEAETE